MSFEEQLQKEGVAVQEEEASWRGVFTEGLT